MPGVIYRQADGEIAFPVAPGQPFRGLEVEVERNVLPNYGGDLDDFAWLDLSDNEFWDVTGLTYVRVLDGEVTGRPRKAEVDTNPPPAVTPSAEWVAAADARIAALSSAVSALMATTNLPDVDDDVLGELDGLDTLPPSGNTDAELDDILSELEGL